MADNAKHSVIESGTEIDGTIKSQCGITVSGKLHGQISAPSLNVTASGSVHGKVKVTQLKTQGELAGEIEAESVELSGRVSDQTVIRARSLEVMLTQQQGGMQVTFGNCDLQIGDMKAKSNAKPHVMDEEEELVEAAKVLLK